MMGAIFAAVTALRLAPAIAGEAIVTNQVADSVTIVDTATMAVLAEVKTGGKPAGIAIDGERRFAYVTAPEGKELIELDASELRVNRRLALGGGPLGVAAHPAKAEVYVADWYAHKVMVIDDGKPNQGLAEIAVGQSPSGSP